MSPSDQPLRLSSLSAGMQGRVVRVAGDNRDRADRLAALGVTPGSPVTVLQRFPSVVFLCDQTELAVEPAVADAILVDTTALPDRVW
jgi:DtxR family transcriptional regulator, Mn-dependent transcriptional regulator